ncbi:ABC transporter ATP-binding protein, partial [Streptomyces sp. SID3343]|nr:ABC transporter ATP-binding protein [Streptomyces sp. SID3343]
MIRQLRAVVNDPLHPEGAERDALRPILTGLVVESVLQGLAFTVLVPVLTALFDGDNAAAGRWLIVLAGLTLAYGVVRYRTQLTAYRTAVALARTLFQRLGDHIAR